MENLNLKIESPQSGELIIRTGEALKPIPKNKVFIEANIKAPGEYLLKRKEVINQQDSLVVASYSNGRIEFHMDVHSELVDCVSGSLIPEKTLAMLGVNTDKGYSAKELAKHLKKCRILFPDETEFSKLVGKLMRFQAKVNTTIEKSAEQSGSSKDLLERQVVTEIPEYFIVKCPIFEGMEDETIRIDIFAEATSESVKFTLESTELISLTIKKGKEIIDLELKPFQDFCPVFIK